MTKEQYLYPVNFTVADALCPGIYAACADYKPYVIWLWRNINVTASGGLTL